MIINKHLKQKIMKAEILTLFTIMTFATIITFGQKKDTVTTRIAQQYDYSWQLTISFDLPGLNPEAIQVSMLDFNPTDKFEKDFDKAYLNEKLAKSKDEKEKTMYTNAEIEMTWDRFFNTVKGNDVNLLTKEGIILSQVVTGDCAPKKMTKWLTSKVFIIDGKPYCYAVPFDFDNGAVLKVTLNESNLISLTDLYKNINK